MRYRISLSEGFEDRFLSALEIGNGVRRIKARKIFGSKYIQFHSICIRHMWHIGRVSETHPKVVGSSPGMICLGIQFLYPAESDKQHKLCVFYLIDCDGKTCCWRQK